MKCLKQLNNKCLNKAEYLGYCRDNFCISKWLIISHIWVQSSSISQKCLKKWSMFDILKGTNICCLANYSQTVCSGMSIQKVFQRLVTPKHTAAHKELTSEFSVLFSNRRTQFQCICRQEYISFFLWTHVLVENCHALQTILYDYYIRLPENHHQLSSCLLAGQTFSKIRHLARQTVVGKAGKSGWTLEKFAPIQLILLHSLPVIENGRTSFPSHLVLRMLLCSLD